MEVRNDVVVFMENIENSNEADVLFSLQTQRIQLEDELQSLLFHLTRFKRYSQIMCAHLASMKRRLHEYHGIMALLHELNDVLHT